MKAMKAKKGIVVEDISNSYPWTIYPEFPGQDKSGNNGFTVCSVRCEFNFLSEDEKDEIIKFLSSDENDELGGVDGDIDADGNESKEQKNNRYFARKILRRYHPDDFQDANGPIESNDAGIERFLNYTPNCFAILTGYRKSQGGKKALQGN